MMNVIILIVNFLDKRSILFGYYCLFFLKEMLTAKSFENVLSKLSSKNPIQNEIFISSYFKKL